MKYRWLILTLVASWSVVDSWARRDPFTLPTTKPKKPALRLQLIGVVAPQTADCCSVALLQVADQQAVFQEGELVQIGELRTDWRITQIGEDKVVLARVTKPQVLKELTVTELVN